ncbi:hypothetical protein Dalk_1226 [Desulfatibacillum aliphaticivorans]|uniref:Uncharacterized protein n=2 Tax=Desulfatibacillum aliphaticivorans TaxID=218208 RepID=B8F9I3_DESAL|nr:hypothetical protein Dalk_1226 [Desulfatibacillum aliphaticivorans]
MAYANIIWPGLIVTNCYWSWLPIISLGFIFEAAILRWRLVPSAKKALLISLAANAFSSTIGIFALFLGTFSLATVEYKITGRETVFGGYGGTIGVMFAGTTFFEVLVTRVIWKYPLKRTFPAFALGNLLSYGVVVIDLFFLGGPRQYY